MAHICALDIEGIDSGCILSLTQSIMAKPDADGEAGFSLDDVLLPDAYTDSTNTSDHGSLLRSSSPFSKRSADATSPATSLTLLESESSGNDDLLPSETDSFLRSLHSRLVLVQMEQEYGKDLRSQYKKNAYRFSLLRRSKSVCYSSAKLTTVAKLFRSTSTPDLRVSRRDSIQCRQRYKTTSKDNTRKRTLDAAEISSEDDVCVAKRLKQDTIPYTVPRIASLRKAKTLRAMIECDDCEQDDLVPTAPITPKLVPSPAPEDPLASIPIISPSQTPLPRTPLSAEATAKVRIAKYKEREERTFDHDHTRCLGEGFALGSRRSAEEWETLLGLGEENREDRIAWLLHYLPFSEGDKQNTSFEYSSPDLVISSMRENAQPPINLANQLLTSPETRFHAAWMFLRYLYLVALKKREAEEICWKHDVNDYAVASLSISVKFHRDTLRPLIQVDAPEFIRLYRYDIGYEELESVQREMLGSFAYELGVTPQPFLDQVWVALPSLRKLLDFDGGWNQVKKETWWMLLQSLYAPDVMEFPISVLTTAALCKAIVDVLEQRNYYRSSWNTFFNLKRGVKVASRFRVLACEDADRVMDDIQDVIGVSYGKMRKAQRWMEENVSSY